MKTIRIMLLISMFCVPIIAYSQSNDGGGGEGGNGGGETKIWEPDLVELWIYWHKKQHEMFKTFYHNEDTLRKKQNEEYQDWMRKLREVDEILFKQYQDNDIPKIPFFAPDMLYAIQLTEELGTIMVNTGTMLHASPVDPNLLEMYFDANVKTTLKIVKIIIDGQKVLNGWERTNLRDNNVRDNLVDYIIKELTAMVGNWNQLYRRTSVAKYAKLLDNY